MLAKLSTDLPEGGGFLYEPKWDGFRAIVFRGAADVYIQSRDLRPLDRYFPELHEVLIDDGGRTRRGQIAAHEPRARDDDLVHFLARLLREHTP